MRVLVTGGAGFIGSHIVDQCISSGHQVVVADNLSTGKRENLNPAAELVETDITTPYMRTDLHPWNYDAVVHQAAQPSVPCSVKDPLFDGYANIIGTLNLLECCRQYNIKRFITASSAAVYGEPEEIPLRESASTRPLSPYGLSKLTAERYARLYGELYGLETVVFRYANVYGPRQDMLGEAGVVCLFITQILRGEQPVIHGDGLQTRDFVFVADIARANLLALSPETPPGVYNVGSGAGTSITQLFALISSGRFPPVHTQSRTGDIKHSILDSNAIKDAIGWQPQVPLREGLAQTVDYYRQNM